VYIDHHKLFYMHVHMSSYWSKRLYFMVWTILGRPTSLA